MNSRCGLFRGLWIGIVVFALGLTMGAPAQAWTPTYTSALGYTMNILSHFNVTTLSDFSSGSDVEGRTFIGRDFTGANSAQFAIHLNSPSTTDDALVVTRNIVSGSALHIESGSLYIGGTTNGRTIEYNGGGTQYANPQPDVATLTSKLQTASTQLALYSANNSVVVANGQATFNVTTLNSCGFAIFSVNASDIFSNQNINQVDINYNSLNPSGVFINVAGTSLSWTGNANLIGSFTQTATRSKVLWNLYQATAVNTQSRNMMGAVLAPLADVQATGNFDGQLAFKSLTTSSEAHLYSFTPDLTCLSPTASELVTFRGQSAEKGIRLRWQTGTEASLIEFNVLRSNKKNGTYKVITPAPIPAKALGMVTGANYRFLDRTAVPGKRYFYRLEIVQSNGKTLSDSLAARRKPVVEPVRR